MKIGWVFLNPVDAIKNNANPRTKYANRGVTDPIYARFAAVEANNFEALPMFGIAVLAALQVQSAAFEISP